jgi:hypothetical protein
MNIVIMSVIGFDEEPIMILEVLWLDTSHIVYLMLMNQMVPNNHELLVFEIGYQLCMLTRECLESHKFGWMRSTLACKNFLSPYDDITNYYGWCF